MTKPNSRVLIRTNPNKESYVAVRTHGNETYADGTKVKSASLNDGTSDHSLKASFTLEPTYKHRIIVKLEGYAATSLPSTRPFDDPPDAGTLTITLADATGTELPNQQQPAPIDVVFVDDIP